MKRTLLISFFVLIASCTPETPPEPATPVQKTFEWKLITTWPKNFPVLGTAPERLATMVDEMSNGRLKLKVYGAGELIPAFEVFDAVESGTAEIGNGAAYYWRGKLPVAAVFSSVPFGMNAQETNSWLRYGGGIALWRKLYEPFGMIPMASGNTGVQMAGWFNKELSSLDDLNGMKMRIPGFGGAVLQRAGGVPVVLPGGEIYTALQTGVVDAIEWVGPYNDLAFGFHEIAEYYYYPGWHEPGTTLETIINAEAWRELPPDLQKILEVAIQAMSQDMLDEFTARNVAALKTLVEDHDVKLRRLPNDILREFRSLSKDVVLETIGDDELAKSIADSYYSYLEEMRGYHAITERAYFEARDERQ